MKCLNLSFPTTYQGKKTTLDTIYKDLSDILGNEKAAYAALAYNEGFPMDSTSIGEPSTMFSDLQELTGSYDRATTLKAMTTSKGFVEKFGDWVNSSPDVGDLTAQGEPKVYMKNGLSYYIDKNYDVLPVFPGHDYVGVDVTKDSKGIPARDYLANNYNILSTLDSTDFYDFLLNKTDEYNITIKGQGNSALKTMLREVVDRDVQRLTPSKRNISDVLIKDFMSVLQDYAEDPNVQEMLDIYKESGSKGAVDILFNNSYVGTLDNILIEDQPNVTEEVTLYDKLRDIALYPLGNEITSYKETRVFTDQVLGVSQPDVFESKELGTSRLKTSEELEFGEIVKLLKNLYEKDMYTALRVGSIAVYKDKIARPWGTNKVIITDIDRDMITAIPVESAKSPMTVTNLEEHFKKQGDYYTIQQDKNGTYHNIAVINPNIIFDMTTAKTIESKKKRKKYLDKALKYAQTVEVQEEIEEVVPGLQVSSNAQGIEYALTNANRTSPKGKVWDKKKFAEKNKSTRDWFNRFKDGFVFNGKHYLDLEDAYQKNKDFYEIMSIVTIDVGGGVVREVSERDLFMEDLMYLKFLQYPELYIDLYREVIPKYTSVDDFFGSMVHSTVKGDKHWETSSKGVKRDNGFVENLKNAYIRFDTYVSNNIGTSKATFKVEDITHILQGRQTTI